MRSREYIVKVLCLTAFQIVTIPTFFYVIFEKDRSPWWLLLYFLMGFIFYAMLTPDEKEEKEDITWHHERDSS